MTSGLVKSTAAEAVVAVKGGLCDFRPSDAQREETDKHVATIVKDIKTDV
jgi:hypothetical protein